MVGARACAPHCTPLSPWQPIRPEPQAHRAAPTQSSSLCVLLLLCPAIHVVFPSFSLFLSHREIQSHVPEPFWQIQAGFREAPPSRAACTFDWMRGRLFDEQVAALLYEVGQV